MFVEIYFILKQHCNTIKCEHLQIKVHYSLGISPLRSSQQTENTKAHSCNQQPYRT